MKGICQIILLLFAVTNAQDTTWIRTFGGSHTEEGYSVQQTTDGGYIITGLTFSFGNGSGDVWLIKTDSNGDSLWSHTFGGISNDEGRSVWQCSDGGYIITGKTKSFGNGDDYEDVWLIKTDSNGDSLWSKTFGGSNYDRGYSVQQTLDDGFIIVGKTNSFGNGGDDVWLIKTNSNGDSLWSHTYGGSGGDEGYSVQQTADGGYIITGRTRSFATGSWNVWLIKTDGNGYEEWNETYGSLDEGGLSVKQTPDGGYIITGYKSSNNTDLWLIKTDSQGNNIWDLTFGGNSLDVGSSLDLTYDGGYIIAGETQSYGIDYDILLIKTFDPQFAPVLEPIADQSTDEDSFIDISLNASHPYHHPIIFSAFSNISSVITTVDNSNLNLSFEDNWYGSSTITVIATDDSSNSDSTSFIITVNPINDSPEPFTVIYPLLTDTISTHPDGDSLIFFSWHRSTDVDNEVTYRLVIELEFFGNTYTDEYNNITDTIHGVESTRLNQLLTALNLDESELYWFVESSDGEYSVVSDTGRFYITNESLKLKSDLLIPTQLALNQNYPNPFNPVTTINYGLPTPAFVEIAVYDMLGRQIKTLVNENQEAGYRTVIWNGMDDNGRPVSTGLYLYMIKAGDFTQTRKMILLK